MVKSKIDEFISNDVCRKESNQHKASKLFEELKPTLSKEDINEISVEWSHFTRELPERYKLKDLYVNGKKS